MSLRRAQRSRPTSKASFKSLFSKGDWYKPAGAVQTCQPARAAKHGGHPSGMNNEILWLIRLGLDQKLFTRDQALTIIRVLGREVALMDFAQKLIDDGIVTEVEKLEAIAGDAMARAAQGAPEGNPLLDDAASTPPLSVAGKAKATAPAGTPQFPFDQLPSLDDAGLTKAM